MPQHHRKATASLTEAVADGDALGLTSAHVSPQPVLFGSELVQSLLLEIARSGEAQVTRSAGARYQRLVKVGLCRVRADSSSDVLTLDARHPAIAEICVVLSDLSGVPVIAPEAVSEAGLVHPKMPLGHLYETPFRIMLVLAQAGCALDVITIQRRLPDRWPSRIGKRLDVLVVTGF